MEPLRNRDGVAAVKDAPGFGTNRGPSRALEPVEGGGVCVSGSEFSRANIFVDIPKLLTLLVTSATTCCNELRKLILLYNFSRCN